MLSTCLSMHRPSLRQTPATVIACTGAQRGIKCGDIGKGYDWINLDFVLPDPGGGCGT